MSAASLEVKRGWGAQVGARTTLVDTPLNPPLAVGLQHAVPPTNTKFKTLLIPTQAGMPYTNVHKHRTSDFTSTLTFLGPMKVHFYRPTKTVNSCDFLESAVALSM